jgi:hypothetical protein
MSMPIGQTTTHCMKIDAVARRLTVGPQVRGLFGRPARLAAIVAIAHDQRLGIPDRALEPRPGTHPGTDLFAGESRQRVGRGRQGPGPGIVEGRCLPDRERRHEGRRVRDIKDDGASGEEGDQDPDRVLAGDLETTPECETLGLLLQPFATVALDPSRYDKLMAERPEYFVFNGTTQALKTNPLAAKVGETVRVFFGVGGPNYTSSFHVIGEIFDKAYPFAALSRQPLHDVQTISTPPGGASVVELKLDVPGNYVLVDHALTRVERGLAGLLKVDGPANDAVFKDYDPQKSAMSTSGH